MLLLKRIFFIEKNYKGMATLGEKKKKAHQYWSFPEIGKTIYRMAL